MVRNRIVGGRVMGRRRMDCKFWPPAAQCAIVLDGGGNKGISISSILFCIPSHSRVCSRMVKSLHFGARLLSVTWKAAVLADAPGIGKLEAQELPPIRQQELQTSILLSLAITRDDQSVARLILASITRDLVELNLSSKTKRFAAKQLTSSLESYYERPDGSLNAITSAAGHHREEPCSTLSA